MERLPRLPDLLTTANLSCGVASILSASAGELTLACWLLFLAALFDVFDGLAARAMGGGSELGKQLDSLADMVSFGVAPSYALWSASRSMGHSASGWIAGAALCICIASAWRLAKFNLDSRQSTGFLGLPTPANGLFWASLVLVALNEGVLYHGFTSVPWEWRHKVFLFPALIFATALVLGICMLTELPLPGLKFKHKGWKGNEVVFLLLPIGAALLLLFGLLAVPLLLILYLLSPLWGKSFSKTT